MPIFGEKPFTLITVKINQLTTPQRNADLEDDLIEPYLDDLLALIKLQLSGATEAARALRKRIKHGAQREQLLALHLLELLVLNAGPRIGHVLASDDRLLDTLRTILQGGRLALGDYDAAVVRRVRNLAAGWRLELRDMEGYAPLAALWRLAPKGRLAELPRSPPPRPQAKLPFLKPAKESREPTPREPKPREKKKGSKKTKGRKHRRGVVYADEQYQIPQINYRVEAPKIRTAIADCHTHTAALGNALLVLPAGSDPLEDTRCAAEFELCRKVRRAVLRYLQYVGAGDAAAKSKETQALDDEFLGPLILANEQLVAVFQRFDAACGYTDANGPSARADDLDLDESYYTSDDLDDDLADRLADVQVAESSSRLQEAVRAPPPPPKPASPRPPVVRRDTAASTGSDDPFGDSNAVVQGQSQYY